MGMARGYLEKYPQIHHGLNRVDVLGLIDLWRGHLEQEQFKTNPLHKQPPPILPVPLD